MMAISHYYARIHDACNMLHDMQPAVKELGPTFAAFSKSDIVR